MRWFHLYASMVTFIIVLFFALTGVTLNHPEWTWGGGEKQTSVTGTLPETAVRGESVDWFVVSEYLRKTHSLHGTASENRVDNGEGSLSYRGPGYAAEVYFKLADRKYEVRITTQGWLGVMNDLHRGRDSGKPWSWVVDVSGIVLALVSLSGLAILFFLKKARLSGLAWTVIGLIATCGLIWLATR
jgi:hypothetical protein